MLIVERSFAGPDTARRVFDTDGCLKEKGVNLVNLFVLYMSQKITVERADRVRDVY